MRGGALDFQVHLKVYAGEMTSYQIGEVAERSGFSTATLRYYEEIGLLPPTPRTAGGYRVYDQAVLDRLAFITRTRQLGCTLEEINDLTTAWDGGRCGPVQDRLRLVVAEKLVAARRQIIELSRLTSDLQRAAASLEEHRPDGACDDRCGCITDTAPSAPRAPQQVSLTPKRVEEPIACTLDTGHLQDRTEEWNGLLAHVSRRDPIAGGLRACLDPDTPLDELIRLVAAERGCCRFLDFAITIDGRGLALEVTAAETALPIITAIFGGAS